MGWNVFYTEQVLKRVSVGRSWDWVIHFYTIHVRFSKQRWLCAVMLDLLCTEKDNALQIVPGVWLHSIEGARITLKGWWCFHLPFQSLKLNRTRLFYSSFWVAIYYSSTVIQDSTTGLWRIFVKVWKYFSCILEICIHTCRSYV